jgi:hypothetical protein
VCVENNDSAATATTASNVIGFFLFIDFSLIERKVRSALKLMSGIAILLI